jgi:hypothetical protein
MATNSDAVTSGYDFPPHMAGDPVGGLVDVSAAAPGHSTSADAAMQQQLQDFFAARQRQEAAGPRQEQHRDQQQAVPGPIASADEGTGQGEMGRDSISSEAPAGQRRR